MLAWLEQPSPPSSTINTAVPSGTLAPSTSTPAPTNLMGNGTTVEAGGNSTAVAGGNVNQSALPSNGNPFQGKPTAGTWPNNVLPAYLTWKKPVPNQTAPPLFKIGRSNITLEWTADPNAVKVQPTNLTLAVANPQKLTSNIQVLAGTATEAYWDLAKTDPQSPLMVGFYTVLVYDQRGPKAAPSPGWLMPDNHLVVALYSTEAYVGRTDSMFCPSCYVGNAISFHRSALPILYAFGVALVTSLLIICSLV
ncbi:hypothetical protein DM01DRAFT_1390924 [Hesseltinella vesiculosa]|uniref:DUF7137 domain-containing protein n=1 Tax=Hesseltinella vesiculosa TaxID=101127 RepID=A0A1X2GG89_9FUNG|nr:hypothetical protein DM01DRAFT_1390924 [Hesseltinella vesiculosa]